MLKNTRIGAFCATLAALSFNVNAAIIDYGVYTEDTVSGLDWLDLTSTINMSYNQVTAELGAGGSLAGWRYATETEIVGFFDAFGGDSLYYNSGQNVQNNGLFNLIAPLWGDIVCEKWDSGCDIGMGTSYFWYDGEYSDNSYTTRGRISDYYGLVSSPYEDYTDITYSQDNRFGYSDAIGSALVRDYSVVPVPAAAWLFGSGLIGLIGVARRKKA